MKRLAIACVLGLAMGKLAFAEPEAARFAREAAAALGDAAAQLDAAETATDRIKALTDTIRAYESGLAALREDVRRVVIEERELAQQLAAQDAEIGAFLAVLQTVSRTNEASGLFHPGSAVDGVRAGLLTSSLIPALEQRADAVSRQLEDLNALRTVREASIATLKDGLEGVRRARLSLSSALSERTDLPEPAATDAAAMEALINSTETLSAFADSLALVTSPGSEAQNLWDMPVIGRVVRGFQEADETGTRQPGWTLATLPEALVTSPADATVRFSGVLGEGNPAIILETAPGTLVILTGHAQSFVTREQIVSIGEPIALMGEQDSPPQENLNETSLLGGQHASETLYIEIRQGQAPVDPTTFLRPT